MNSGSNPHLVYVPLLPQLLLKWKAPCFHLNVWNFDLFGIFQDLSAAPSQTHLSHTVQWVIGPPDTMSSICNMLYKTGSSLSGISAVLASPIPEQLSFFFFPLFRVTAPLCRRGTPLPPFATRHGGCSLHGILEGVLRLLYKPHSRFLQTVSMERFPRPRHGWGRHNPPEQRLGYCGIKSWSWGWQMVSVPDAVLESCADITTETDDISILGHKGNMATPQPLLYREIFNALGQKQHISSAFQSTI